MTRTINASADSITEADPEVLASTRRIFDDPYGWLQDDTHVNTSCGLKGIAGQGAGTTQSSMDRAGPSTSQSSGSGAGIGLSVTQSMF